MKQETILTDSEKYLYTVLQIPTAVERGAGVV